VYTKTGALLVARKEVTDKVKDIYISVFRYQNAEQNDKVKVGNKSFDHVTKVNTLETTLNMKIIFTKNRKSEQIQFRRFMLPFDLEYLITFF
jgi:hypothetical protein